MPARRILGATKGLDEGMMNAPQTPQALRPESEEDTRPSLFSRTASAIARVTGRPATFLTSCAVVVLWALSGPYFHYSDTWQLMINTSTTIITFLMVFLIQNTQSREGAALQAKLDELIRATATAHNTLIALERMSDNKVEKVRESVAQLAAGEEV